MDLVPASTLAPARLAGQFTACYEGYFVPIAVDEATLQAMVRHQDVDLDASLVALSGGEPVGVALLALRDGEGWVAGMGVVPPLRGQGVGRRLLDGLLAAARSRGARRVRLEVIEQNLVAKGLYEQAGFGVTRDVEVWKVPLEGIEPADAAEMGLEDALAWIGERRTAEEPWQRDARTVLNAAQDRGDTIALVTGAGDRRTGVVALRLLGATALLQQLAADEPGAVRELLAGARARGAERAVWVNATAGDPALPELAALGGACDVRQHEMALHLA